MFIQLNMSGETPIYVQLRNQIVLGISQGKLRRGERLPSVRQMASDIGVNTMTVNKSYQILKNEGFIQIDRRHGAKISKEIPVNQIFKEKLEAELELLMAEAVVRGMEEKEFAHICSEIFNKLQPNLIANSNI